MTMLEVLPSTVDESQQEKSQGVPERPSTEHVIAAMVAKSRLGKWRVKATYRMLSRASMQTPSYVVGDIEKLMTHRVLMRLMPDEAESSPETVHELIERHFSTPERVVKLIHTKTWMGTRLKCAIVSINVSVMA